MVSKGGIGLHIAPNQLHDRRKDKVLAARRKAVQRQGEVIPDANPSLHDLLKSRPAGEVVDQPTLEQASDGKFGTGLFVGLGVARGTRCCGCAPEVGGVSRKFLIQETSR